MVVFGDISSDFVGEVLLNIDNNDLDRSFKFGVILVETDDGGSGKGSGGGGCSKPNNCCR